MSELNNKFNRRGVLKSSMALLAGGLFSSAAENVEAQPAVKNVNLHSSPSTLKITDMRYAIVVKPGPSPCVLIRIDTNQGVYGLGEVRDIAGYQYAMVLKSRIVGENPLNIDYLFEKIAQFGGGARQAGGVCAVEMALWDIAGKVYNLFTRCLEASGVKISESMPIQPNRRTQKSMEYVQRNVRRWGSPGSRRILV
jgi:hypothetical protein